MYILVDDNNYIKEYVLLEIEGYVPRAEEVKIAEPVDISHFLRHSNSYRLVDGVLVFDKVNEQLLMVKRELDELRLRREKECFVIINRGMPWYNTLTDKQKQEIDVWYKAWLDVTETRIVPEKLIWLR